MKRALVLAILLGLSLFATADSYNIIPLGDDNGHGLYGIDVSGKVVIWGSDGCFGAEDYTYCYVTWDRGAIIDQSNTIPHLAYDNRTTCPAPSEHFYATEMFCNSAGDIAWVDPRREETYLALCIKDISEVPEPWSLALFGTGLLLMGWCRWRVSNPQCA